MLRNLLSVIICLIMMLQVVPVSNAQALSFSDLQSSHWAYNAITTMVSKGILNGYEDGTFKPDALVTREEFAKILVRSLSLPEICTESPTFSDVNQSRWSYQYVESTTQYIAGYDMGNTLVFNGSNFAIREDVATAIAKAKGIAEMNPNLTMLDNFSDKNDISQNLRGYVANVISCKLMQGDGTKFNPQKTLTRAEACMLGYNLSLTQGPKVTLNPLSGSKVAAGTTIIITSSEQNITFYWDDTYDVTQTQNSSILTTTVPGTNGKHTLHVISSDSDGNGCWRAYTYTTDVPKVISTTPADGATNVDTNTEVSVVYNEDIKPRLGKDDVGVYYYDVANPNVSMIGTATIIGNKVVFGDINLKPGKTYVFETTGAAENPTIERLHISFTTKAGAPESIKVVNTTPKNNAVGVDSTATVEVVYNTTFTANLYEEILTATYYDVTNSGNVYNASFGGMEQVGAKIIFKNLKLVSGKTYAFDLVWKRDDIQSIHIEFTVK